MKHDSRTSIRGGIPSMLALVITSGTLLAQSPSLELATAIGGSANDRANAVATDGNGNVFTGGYFEQSIDVEPGANATVLTAVGNRDIVVASYDTSHTLRWAFSIGGTMADEAVALAVDAGGNVIVVGNFFGSVDFDPGPGIANISSPNGGPFVAKYSPTGNYLWAFSLGTGGAFDVDVDGNNNVVVVGIFNGAVDFNPGTQNAVLASSNGLGSMFLAKYSAAGAYLWAFKLDGGKTKNSQYNRAIGRSITLDASNNVYVTGLLTGTIDFNAGSGIANLVSAGPNPNQHEGDMFLAKYSSTGLFAWAIRAGGSLGDNGQDLALDGSGNVCVTGTFRGTVDFNPGSDIASLTSAGGQDVVVARYSPAGVYVSAFRIGESSDDFPWRIESDLSGYVTLIGQFVGTADFDPGPGVAVLSSMPATNRNQFVAHYGNSDDHLWSFTQGMAAASSIAYDASNDLTVVGIIHVDAGAIDFDPSESSWELASTGGYDMFIARYGAQTMPKARARELTRKPLMQPDIR